MDEQPWTTTIDEQTTEKQAINGGNRKKLTDRQAKERQFTERKATRRLSS